MFSSIPVFWQPYLTERFSDTLAAAGRPRETSVDCRSCLMAEAQLKCCTFFPFVANFAMGRRLAVSDIEFGAILAGLSAENPRAAGYAQPLGLVPSADYRRRFAQTPFGRDGSLLCPFFRTSTVDCGIWADRPSACSTYFCGSSYGTRGLELWSRLGELLNHAEHVLAQWALLESGFTWPEIKRCIACLSDTGTYERNLWMEFASDQKALYLRCWRFADSLSVADLRAHLGEETGSLEDHVERCLRQLRSASDA